MNDAPLLNNNGINSEEFAHIQMILDNQINSWNIKDAEGFGRDFDDDGSFTNIMGAFSVGKTSFISKHERIFNSAFSRSQFHQEPISIKFIRPDVAIVETRVTVENMIKLGPFANLFTNEEGQFHTCLLQVLTKKEMNWKIVAYHNVDVKGATAEKT